MIGTVKNIPNDGLIGRPDLTTLVCWVSSKTTDSMYFGKHGWNHSRWHILKPGESFQCLCGREIAYYGDFMESFSDPTGPFPDRDGRQRDYCRRCFRARQIARLKGETS